MVAELTPEQSKAARALLNWSQVRLSAKCNLSEGTIRDFENGIRTPRPLKVAAIRQAFESAGVVFVSGASPILSK
ncbi:MULTISPECIES: multiprotein-bridging factor 1 family protein [unclassified Mesorhizobium]|uniref:helix-turn-helix domain-containing protein n=1 Tax=unclassified Mesorhizobium TaxID=325217 RepID=UPI001CC975A0|nr:MULTISPECIES: helix-turn-helix transcriptional regulator [unclassified Mesorhizobium]MBZ9734562.1 helix-turn-helix domain-containing protein [Mesorhizobium sp. CA9]MBZ9812113.1 helix-turn-helix domain-containing protein [Mesorhizobium sp. CA7]MBZ9826902.1 helix-turn-helix domain-containing protein [Mesorhizobium sp. CA18]MBZ9832476.1 helix-turn-helix domain-containing protein [Mesorhizobium sp. CA2]MBZ9838468.1 helix-turn-helix domain-containing protein [Mesorhizobium sp. CA3]